MPLLTTEKAIHEATVNLDELLADPAFKRSYSQHSWGTSDWLSEIDLFDDATKQQVLEIVFAAGQIRQPKPVTESAATKEYQALAKAAKKRFGLDLVRYW